jgi:hypothetical protein
MYVLINAQHFYVGFKCHADALFFGAVPACPSFAEPSAFAEAEAPRGCAIPIFSSGWEWLLGCL